MRIGLNEGQRSTEYAKVQSPASGFWFGYGLLVSAARDKTYHHRIGSRVLAKPQNLGFHRSRL